MQVADGEIYAFLTCLGDPFSSSVCLPYSQWRSCSSCLAPRHSARARQQGWIRWARRRGRKGWPPLPVMLPACSMAWGSAVLAWGAADYGNGNAAPGNVRQRRRCSRRGRRRKVEAGLAAGGGGWRWSSGAGNLDGPSPAAILHHAAHHPSPRCSPSARGVVLFACASAHLTRGRGAAPPEIPPPSARQLPTPPSFTAPLSSLSRRRPSPRHSAAARAAVLSPASSSSPARPTSRKPA
jgi:hypothetical protein